MSARMGLALAALLAGIPLAAWGLAEGVWLAALAGLALVLGFVYTAMSAIARANRPQHKITPAANSAWAMKDEPPARGDEKQP